MTHPKNDTTADSKNKTPKYSKAYSDFLSTVKVLKPSDVFDVMKLQQTVINDLPQEDQNFIIPKTGKQFLKRMSNVGQMLGVYDESKEGNKLIAYSTLAFPNSAWPVADMVYEKDDLPCEPSSLAVIQNNVVHPQHRNKSLNTMLIAAQAEVCGQLGREHLMAEIAASNPASLKGFLNLSFKVVNAAIDPEDQCKLLFVHRKVRYVREMTMHRSNIYIDPVEDFNAMKSYVTSWFKGVAMERSPDKKSYSLILKPGP